MTVDNWLPFEADVVFGLNVKDNKFIKEFVAFWGGEADLFDDYVFPEFPDSEDEIELETKDICEFISYMCQREGGVATIYFSVRSFEGIKQIFCRFTQDNGVLLGVVSYDTHVDSVRKILRNKYDIDAVIVYSDFSWKSVSDMEKEYNNNIVLNIGEKTL